MNNEQYREAASKIGCHWRLLKALHLNKPAVGMTNRDWLHLKRKYDFMEYESELAFLYLLGERIKFLNNESPLEQIGHIKKVLWAIPHEDFDTDMTKDRWLNRVWDEYLDIYTSERDIERVFINNFRLPCVKVTVRRGKIWIHGAEFNKQHAIDKALYNNIPFKVRIDGIDCNFTRIKITEEGDLYLWTTQQ